MYYLIDMCFLCLKSKTDLRLLRDSHLQRVIYKKLINCMPEFDDECFKFAKICQQCAGDVESVHCFQEKCLVNSKLFLNYVNKLKSVSKVEGKIYIYIQDVDTIVKTENDEIRESQDDVVNSLENVRCETERLESLTVMPIEEIRIKEEVNYDYEEIMIKEEINDDFCDNSEEREFNLFECEENLKLQDEEVNLAKYIVENHIADPAEGTSQMNTNETCPDGTEMTKYLNIEMLTPNESFRADVNEKYIFPRLPTQSIVKNQFTCGYCSESFITVDLLNKHVHSHAEKPYRCEQCHQTFTHRASLRRHLWIHSGEKPFTCQYCFKSFRASGTLTVHTRTHTGETPYECQECPRTFNSRSQLSNHSRTHTGEKPFVCTQCWKSFRTNSVLVVHMRIHTGDTPYKCELCSKLFKQKPNLNRHMRSHTLKKSFRCNICKNAFRSKKSLKQHRLSH